MSDGLETPGLNTATDEMIFFHYNVKIFQWKIPPWSLSFAMRERSGCCQEG